MPPLSKFRFFPGVLVATLQNEGIRPMIIRKVVS